MCIAGESRRNVYLGIWCLVVLAVLWLQLGGLSQRFANERDLIHLDPGDRITTFAVYDRMGVSPTTMAVGGGFAGFAGFAGYAGVHAASGSPPPPPPPLAMAGGTAHQGGQS